MSEPIFETTVPDITLSPVRMGDGADGGEPVLVLRVGGETRWLSRDDGTRLHRALDDWLEGTT